MAANPRRSTNSTGPATSGAVKIAAPEPSRVALNKLHRALVRSFVFDNIDVLLGQHPGDRLAAVQLRSAYR